MVRAQRVDHGGRLRNVGLAGRSGGVPAAFFPLLFPLLDFRSSSHFPDDLPWPAVFRVARLDAAEPGVPLPRWGVGVRPIRAFHCCLHQWYPLRPARKIPALKAAQLMSEAAATAAIFICGDKGKNRIMTKAG